MISLGHEAARSVPEDTGRNGLYKAAAPGRFCRGCPYLGRAVFSTGGAKSSLTASRRPYIT